ncbi:MAG TPA: VWA domain-containing protein [Chthoniobacterales bacterium]|nr:VWA domain-containing protein [Chthoniobacterales bacterium]
METLIEEPPAKASRVPRRYSASVLITVIALHLVFGSVAAIWVVSRYSAARKLTFNAGPKSPNPSERALEHRVQLQKKMQSVSAPPAVPKRVLTTGAAKIVLPPMPEIKAAENPPRSMMSASGTGTAFGTTGGNSLGGGGGGNGSQINFFGIRDVSTSVVIMIDVSDSMFTRTGDAQYPSKLVRHGKEQNFQVVRDEAIKLMQSLTPQTRFGIVRWSGGAHPWKTELVPATEENKQAAIAHIQNEVDYKTARPPRGKPGGTRHDLALEEAFSLKPETIYMLTDGNATVSQPGGGLKPIPPQEIYKVAEEGQKELSKRAHLHVIYYLSGKEKPDEVAMLRGLASRNGGKFQKVEAKGRKK